jgi:peptidoglycan/LPS O-acetylase OafA/YrhL
MVPALRIFEHALQPLTVFWALNAAFRVVVAIAFTLLVSYGTYRLIELPGRAWVRGALRRIIVRTFGQSETQPMPVHMPKRGLASWGRTTE